MIYLVEKVVREKNCDMFNTRTLPPLAAVLVILDLKA